MSRPGRPSRFWEAVAIMIVKPVSRLLAARDWRRGDRLPRQGGVIVVVNHLSWTDPFVVTHYIHNNGRWPVVLVKSGLIGVPVLGYMMRKMLAVPVYRGSADAVRSLKESGQRLSDGACILFYPEGTCTRDPELWPMVGKTGAARLALSSGVPVIPVAHWGTQEILPYGSKKLSLFPRKTVHVQAGPPVDLSKYEGQPLHGTVLRDATADIMAAIAAQLAELRGGKAPDVLFDPSVRGNPDSD